MVTAAVRERPPFEVLVPPGMGHHLRLKSGEGKEVEERLLVTEFVEALQERANDRYKGKLAQAFVDWYIEAEFGGAIYHFQKLSAFHP